MNWERLSRRIASCMGAGWTPEPASVLEAVNAHREYWRPPEVRVLLLAESHVMTTAAEAMATVSLAPFGLADTPSSFVRLVYCLGYGESSLVKPEVVKNAGTPQFWKLLAACVGVLDGGPFKKTTEPDSQRRVQGKIELLHELQRRGVWLLDASPVALYAGGGTKPAAKDLREALRVSWEEYSCERVKEVSPRAVVVIGKTVFDVLGDKLRSAVPRATVDWVYQPQARVSAERHRAGLETLESVVREAGTRGRT